MPFIAGPSTGGLTATLVSIHQSATAPPIYTSNDAPPIYTSNDAPPVYTSNDAPPAYTSNNAPPAYTSNNASPPSDSWVEDLRKLKELKDQGIITEEEFSQSKARILAQRTSM